MQPLQAKRREIFGCRAEMVRGGGNLWCVGISMRKMKSKRLMRWRNDGMSG
jgi:hypothetical protein